MAPANHGCARERMNQPTLLYFASGRPALLFISWLILIGSGCSVEKESIALPTPEPSAQESSAAPVSLEPRPVSPGGKYSAGDAAGDFPPPPVFTPHWSAPNLVSLFRRQAGARSLRESDASPSPAPLDASGFTTEYSADSPGTEPLSHPPPRAAEMEKKKRRKKARAGARAGATIKNTPSTQPKDFHVIEPYLKGIASWYGPKFHGKRTANGEIYNQYGITAAHPTLPIGTIIRVRNMRNRKVVWVRVNDRGPYKKGRILDLSRGAAKRLGMLKEGTAPVQITVLRWPKTIQEDPALLPYTQYVVQVGAYPEPGKAESMLEKIQAQFTWTEFQLDYRPSGLLSIIAGPFSRQSEALSVSKRLLKKGVKNLVRRMRK